MLSDVFMCLSNGLACIWLGCSASILIPCTTIYSIYTHHYSLAGIHNHEQGHIVEGISHDHLHNHTYTLLEFIVHTNIGVCDYLQNYLSTVTT